MTSIKHHRDTVLDSLKSAICKSFFLDLRRHQDAWLRSVTRQSANALQLLDEVVEQSTRFAGWELVGQGLVELALGLLDTSAGLGKPDLRVRAAWQLGSDVLQKVLARASSSLGSIVKALTARIVSSRGAVAYVACLNALVREHVPLLMENPAQLNPLVDHITCLDVSGAGRVLRALLPLVKRVRSIRDAVILTLRKALFARSTEVKQIGVEGVLKLLKGFRISSALPVTQLSQSSSSLSQVAVDIHRGVTTSNESLCGDLLGVIRRVLTLPAEVKIRLYQGLYDVVCCNPELCSGVLDILYLHAFENKWIVPDGESALLDLDKLVALDDGNPFVMVSF
jgi:Fanconi anemia group I protein